MRYVGVVIQQLWTEDAGPGQRDRRRRQRDGAVPGSVRRRTSPRRTGLD